MDNNWLLTKSVLPKTNNVYWWIPPVKIAVKHICCWQIHDSWVIVQINLNKCQWKNVYFIFSSVLFKQLHISHIRSIDYTRPKQWETVCCIRRLPDRIKQSCAVRGFTMNIYTYNMLRWVEIVRFSSEATLILQPTPRHHGTLPPGELKQDCCKQRKYFSCKTYRVNLLQFDLKRYILK